jgi:flagellar assembly protein FliH
LSKLVGKDPEHRLPALENRVLQPPSPEGMHDFHPRPIDATKQTGGWRAGGGGSGNGSSDSDGAAVRQQAFQEGFSQGEQAGFQRASEQLRSAIAAWGRTALELATLKAQLRAQAQQELVELALAIARHILRRQLVVDPASVTSVVGACLRQYERAEVRRLAVNPQDLQLVGDYFQQHPVPGLEILGDPKIARGGAVFETAQGRLDATLETQLAEIERGLTDR